MLKKELGIHTFRDLLELFPYRYIDKSAVILIRDLTPENEFVQLVGHLSEPLIAGEGKGRRLVADLRDDTGSLGLVWFQGASWLQKNLKTGGRYLVYGRVSFFNGQAQITHPEMELIPPGKQTESAGFQPVYPSTEKLTARGLGGRQLAKITQGVLAQLRESDIPEILPDAVRQPMQLMSRYEAFRQIHFPSSEADRQRSVNRLKFDELFISQIRAGLTRSKRHRSSRGVLFQQVGPLFNQFYSGYLPFELTAAQKRVLREIRKDTGSGHQMNRLLQGDVGSGKTMVALLAMLLAADNGFQSCLVAPTEILSRQHYTHFTTLLKDLPLRVGLLTGSVKSKQRRQVLEQLADGSLHMLIGTHAVMEDPVVFRQLGFVIVDEQHRFGVAQRARLWAKATVPPHMLVMTATPIPRTLAMTGYGDLDYSVIDELPPGRQPVRTVHRYEGNRPAVMDFIKDEIKKGRQAYIIFPLIEESATLDYENLMKGYENVKAYFPEPAYYMSMVHGRQSSAVKETNMQRFVRGDTQIMVATTVIEVGVNVPNASVMVVESSEKFGLSQLHQLRGRVGRGSEASFCILLTGSKLGREAKERVRILCETNDGFRIAEKDMELRGPGDIAGTKQSGLLDFKLANIILDKPLLSLANHAARQLLESDPELTTPENDLLKNYLLQQHGKTQWSRIS